MRHSPKYPKMLLVDSSLTRKLLPKCCSVMLYLEPSLPWECSKIIDTAGGAVEDRIGTQMYKCGTVKVFSSANGKKNVARVVDADIIAKNGVIHAIDTVI